MNEVLLNNRYQLDRLLGRKSGRRTWLAIDRQTQRQVVIKLLLFSADFEWESLKLFERESKTLQDLDHSAIPKYLDWFETSLDGNTAFALVQTYIPAPSLETVVRSGRTFSSDDLQNIAEQVLQILDYLHSRNPYVIHRDLKPSNLLLGDRTGNSPGMVYLVDFGSVQNLAIAKGGTITIVGTYGYMPPEQFGDRAVPASDLYSLGATLIYLATGKDPADLLSDDFQIQCDSMNHLEPNFRNWIQGLVVTSLRDRPSSVQEAIDRLVNPKTGIRAASESKIPGKYSSVYIQRTAEEDHFEFKTIKCSNEFFILNIPAHLIEVIKLSKMKYAEPRSIFKLFKLIVLLPFMGITITVASMLCLLVMFSPIGTFLAQHFYLLGLAFGILYLIKRALLTRKSQVLIIDQNNIYLTRILKNKDVKRVKEFCVFDGLKMIGGLHEFLTGKNSVSDLKEKIWEIEFRKCPCTLLGRDYTKFQIDLKVGSQVWMITCSPNEIRWLLGELSYYLQVEPKGIL